MLLDELYSSLDLGQPPIVEAKIGKSEGKNIIVWNIDFRVVAKKLKGKIDFHNALPVVGAAHCNRLLWSAANSNCDLFVGRPMDNLLGDKLFETNQAIIKSKEIIDALVAEVEYPDIRKLVNRRKLSLDDILLIRKKSKKFRQWLQNEGERDRNAIIAYHNEVAKDVGLVKYGRKTLSLFGLISPVTGTFVGEKIGGPLSSTIGAGIGVGTKYLLDLASKMGAGWRPVVFGNWLKDRIVNIMKENAD